MISLLGMQGRKNSDPEFQRVIKDIEMRIRSMALIHEHLYRSENLDRIPLSAYLHSLVSIISGTFSGKTIKIDLQLEEILVNIETALPLGLITNELLTNSFKYAFPSDQGGTVCIKLAPNEPGGLTLTVSDNGVGLPVGFSLENQDSLGMFIIKLLVEQLDGSIEIVSRGGVSAIIVIPENI